MAAAVSSGSTALVGDLNPATFFETGPVVEQWLSPQDVANLVMEYLFAPERFGAAQWFHWFGVDVGPEPKFSRKMTLFWNQPGVSDNYLPPVLCPQFIDRQPFTLKFLGQIVQNPQNGGRASKYVYENPVLGQHQDTPAGPACWLVMKKGVEARGQPYAAQVAWIQSSLASHEARIPALHLATVVFTRYVMTGECYLGDRNGWEGCWTYGRCQELAHCKAESYPLAVGGFCSPDGLFIGCSDDDSDSYGVVGLRKF